MKTPHMTTTTYAASLILAADLLATRALTDARVEGNAIGAAAALDLMNTLRPAAAQARRILKRDRLADPRAAVMVRHLVGPLLQGQLPVEVDRLADKVVTRAASVAPPQDLTDWQLAVIAQGGCPACQLATDGITLPSVQHTGLQAQGCAQGGL